MGVLKLAARNHELFPVDVTQLIRYLFEAGYLQPLPFFHGGYELAGIEEAFVRPCIQPGIAPSHELDPEFSVRMIPVVYIRNLKLAP